MIKNIVISCISILLCSISITAYAQARYFRCSSVTAGKLSEDEQNKFYLLLFTNPPLIIQPNFIANACSTSSITPTFKKKKPVCGINKKELICRCTGDGHIRSSVTRFSIETKTLTKTDYTANSAMHRKYQCISR